MLKESWDSATHYHSSRYIKTKELLNPTHFLKEEEVFIL